MSNSMSLDKEARIKKEVARLKRIYRAMPEERKKANEKLIQNAAFLAISLEDLQEIINSKGYTEVYQNGATQSGVKETSEVKIYNAMIKQFTVIVKQLSDYLPEAPEEDDGFDDFLKSKFN